MRSVAPLVLLSIALCLVSAVQLEIDLGQVEAISSIGNFTLYPLAIRADVLHNLLEHALENLKKPLNGQRPSYQFNESDWSYEISGSSTTGLGNDDLTAITQKALSIAPPSSQDSTKTIVGVVKAAGEAIADVVIKPRQEVPVPEHPKPPLFPKRTHPSVPVKIERFGSNKTETSLVIPDNDPALSWFIDRFRALPSDPSDTDLKVNATGQPRNTTDIMQDPNNSTSKRRRRARDSTNGIDLDKAGNSKMINDILGMRRVLPLGNTGFACKVWIWRDESNGNPVVRVTKVKHMRTAIQAAMNTIPLHIEANKRENIRPYNEFAALSSEGLEISEFTEVVFQAWSVKSIYDDPDEPPKPPTKLIDFVWQELGKQLLELFEGRGDEDVAMALDGVLLNTAVHGDPDPFGHVRLMCLNKRDLAGGSNDQLEDQESSNSTTPLLDGAAVARRSS